MDRTVSSTVVTGSVPRILLVPIIPENVMTDVNLDGLQWTAANVSRKMEFRTQTHQISLCFDGVSLS
jgi:hypothetical protein